MIQYENDTTAVARAIAALEAGQTIDHGTARTIAAGYTAGSCTTSMALSSTGTMLEEAELIMWSLKRGVDDATLESDADALTALEAYLTDREESGDTQRVSGWSDMWVPKHVDYPHQSGALDTCWCFEDDDDTDEGCQLCRHIGHGSDEPCRP